MGLSLCGGGVTGAIYEVGCLAALEEGLTDFRASDFDVFIASSSGATVAAAIAGGLSAQRLYRALLDPADDFFPLHRHHLLRFDFREWRRGWRSALSAVRHFVSSAASRPLEVDVWNELDRFWDSLPAGIFTLDAYERFLVEFMTRRGLGTTFESLPGKLLLVASDLDAGTRAVFGEDTLANVNIARATVACSAIPILFAPVRIEGRDYVDAGAGELANVDLAARHGCELVLVINPMVPVAADPEAREVPTGHGRMRRVRDKGLLWVYQQASRMQAEAQLREGLRRFAFEHREPAVVLMEPDAADATMFMYSPMNFAARRAILEHAYMTTLRQLRDPESLLARALTQHGMEIQQPG